MSAPVDLAETDRLLSTTRAVRKRLDLERPVDRSVVMDCIRLSQQAPTPSYTQGWRWMMVDDPDKKAAIAEIYKDVGEKFLPAGRQMYSDNAQTQRVYDSAEYLLTVLHKVPVIAIPCVMGEFETTSNAGAASLYGAILPAVWSFQLALRSRGLGSAWTTIHLYREKDVAEICGIREGVLQVALLPVAYTVGTEFKVAKRPGPETITSWNTFGSV